MAAVFIPLGCPKDILLEPIVVLDDGWPSLRDSALPLVTDPLLLGPPCPPAVVVDSDSFSGDEGPSLEPVSYVIGLYGGINFTLPPFFCGQGKRRDWDEYMGIMVLLSVSLTSLL